jgi:hypothetical protein
VTADARAPTPSAPAAARPPRRYSQHSQASRPLPVPTYSPADSGVLLTALHSPFVSNHFRESGSHVGSWAPGTAGRCAGRCRQLRVCCVGQRL